MKEKKSVHEGHRERLLEVAKNAGFHAMSDIQVVEFFLTYIFPRGDVNPLAHDLLEEYGDFYHILEAEPFDLQRIYGINERSAKKIALFKEFFFYYIDSKMGKKQKINCIADLIDMADEMLRFKNVENMLLVAISPANYVVQRRILTSRSLTTVAVTVGEITSFLQNTKASSFAVAHCHSYGHAYPSGTDDETFGKLQALCNACGIDFIDSYIVGEEGVFSQKDQKLVRTYVDVDEVKEILSKCQK